MMRRWKFYFIKYYLIKYICQNFDFCINSYFWNGEYQNNYFSIPIEWSLFPEVQFYHSHNVNSVNNVKLRILSNGNDVIMDLKKKSNGKQEHEEREERWGERNKEATEEVGDESGFGQE